MVSTVDAGKVSALAVRQIPWSRAARRRAVAASVGLGLVSLLIYASWWIQESAKYGWWMLLLGAFLVFYVFVQIICAWVLYLSVDEPAAAQPPAGLTVDVLVPVYDEPYELVASTLRAVVAMRYPHETYLLDDSRSAAFAGLAAEVGAHYLTRGGNTDAKAGNVNAALKRTQGEFVTIFDVDHEPTPDFLDAALGYFADPAVGFVQTGVAFRNARETFIARATADQAYDIYGPTSMGMHGAGAAVVWGSHTTFRRSALAAIGGYQIGLAEDLHTSACLHTVGWRSVYVPTVHAYGLVPSDLHALTKQQLKWARGVFGILVDVFPRVVRRLTVRQSMAYLVRLTYYLIGPVFLLHAVAAAAVVARHDPALTADFMSYMLHALPLGAAILIVRQIANRMWNPQAGSIGIKVWGYVVACSLWPVYTLGLACAVLHVPIPHLSTPKERVGRPRPLLAAPQVFLAGVLLTTLGVRLVSGFGFEDVPVMLCTLGAAAIQLPVVFVALRP